MPLSRLNSTERLRLMRFVCSFAWADLDVNAKERALVARMVRALRLDASERREVDGWLEHPPRAEEVDPAEIPRAHRQLFLDAIRAIIVADGTVKAAEQEQLATLEELLAG
jgi:uncharacterized tellurite resistance protein B-like protein